MKIYFHDDGLHQLEFAWHFARRLNLVDTFPGWKLIPELNSFSEPCDLFMYFPSEGEISLAQFAYNGGDLPLEEFQSRFSHDAVQPNARVALTVHVASNANVPSSLLDQMSLGYALNELAADSFEKLKLPYLFPRSETDYANSFGLLRLLDIGIKGLYVEAFIDEVPDCAGYISDELSRLLDVLRAKGF